MNGPAADDAANDERIVVDEIGIAFGLVSDFRLKTAFQPIFARQGQSLVPVAVSPSSVLQRGGKTVAGDAFQNLSADDRAVVERIAPRLAVLNLPNIGCDCPDFELVAALSPGQGLTQAKSLFDAAEAVSVAAQRIIFDVSDLVGSAEMPGLAALSAEPMAFAVDLASVSDFAAWAAPREVTPLVRLPAAVFRRILSEQALRTLLSPLIAALHGQGAMVQIDGIETADGLRAALAVGADRMQGSLLGAPALAGTDFDDRPRPISKLIGDRGNVVSLSA